MRDGYLELDWPAGIAQVDFGHAAAWLGGERTELHLLVMSFPHSNARVQAQQGDYAWALWRPYACCQRRGQVFLGSVDFL